jgi:hypothetical protein
MDATKSSGETARGTLFRADDGFDPLKTGCGWNDLRQHGIVLASVEASKTPVYEQVHRLCSGWSLRPGRRPIRAVHGAMAKGSRAVASPRKEQRTLFDSNRYEVPRLTSTARGIDLARISHTNRRIGPTNQRKLLCCKDLRRFEEGPMPTEYSAESFDFGRWKVAVSGLVTSDAGALIDRAIRMMDRFASCFHGDQEGQFFHG